MIDQEQLEFVRDVLDDTLISGQVNGDRVLTALEFVADALQDGETNDGDTKEVPSTSEGNDAAVPADVEPVQESGPSYDSDSS